MRGEALSRSWVSINSFRDVVRAKWPVFATIPEEFSILRTNFGAKFPVIWERALECRRVQGDLKDPIG
jgi:hypothetical protein